MRTRGKSTPYVELLIVVGVLLPVSACTWANPWKAWSGTTPGKIDKADTAEAPKKKKPTVELTPEQQRLYDRYYTEPDRQLGLSSESRAIEEHLGVKNKKDDG